MTVSPPQKIGLYGGTFDPVHHGHLILGRDAVEILGLDQLIFIPAAVSPHKLATAPGATGEERRAMLALALTGEERFRLDDCELHRAGPSYTVETVETLRARFPAGTEFFYLIGEDNVPLLHTWHRVEDLHAAGDIHRLPPPRAASSRRASAFRLSPVSYLPAPFPLRLTRLVDISATEIRNRVARSQSIRYLVPEAVAEFIAARCLYRPPAIPAEK